MAKTTAERSKEFRKRKANDPHFKEKERLRHISKRAKMNKNKIRRQTRERVKRFRNRKKNIPMNDSLSMENSQYSSKAAKMKAVYR